MSSRLAVATYGAVCLGVALRLVQYFAGRSLWNDEAVLALNIIHKSVTGLWKPLYFDQAAPIGFLVVERLVADAIGFSESALRLFPLLCGLVSLPVFAWLARRVLRPVAALFATLLFSVADQLVYYSSEAKPYEADVAATVALLAIGVVVTNRRLTLRSGALAASVGAVAVIFSFAAIFIVAATTVALVLRWLGSARPSSSRAGILALAPVILVSIAMVVFGLVNASAIRRGLGGSSASFLGAAHSSPLHAANLIGTFAASAIGLPQGRPYNQVEKLALVLALVGAASLLRRDVAQFLMLVLPPVLVFAAAALHMYPLLQRAELFLVPAAILLVGEGISWSVDRVRGRARLVLALVLGCAIAAGPVWAAGNHAAHPRLHEELRPVLAYVRDHWRSGDLLYVHGGAQYSFLYYEECGCLRGAALWPLRPELSPPPYGRAAIPVTSDVVVGTYTPERNTTAYIRELVDAVQNHRRVWIVYSHLDFVSDAPVIAALLKRLGQLGTRVAQVDRPGAHAFLFVLRGRR